MSKGKRGFTMVEVIISIILLGTGVAAVMKAMSAISGAEAKSQTTALLRGLANSKYAELRATNDLTTSGDLNGDFSDQGHSDYVWKATSSAQGTTDLYVFTVTVNKQDTPDNNAVAKGLLYLPANTSGGTSGG